MNQIIGSFKRHVRSDRHRGIRAAYVFEVINVLDWKHVELNFGAGEGFTQASNRFVGKMILGFR